MLFIIMMEPLHRLFSLADDRGILTPLFRRGPSQRMSFFADDVMLFMKPVESDLQLCTTLFELFSGASGLRVNMAKTAGMPIRCSEDLTELISTTLGCSIGTFPCHYLGLPLSLRRLTTAQLHDLVNQVANKLPMWRGASLSKSSRLLLVQSVLCAIPIHAMLALDLPPEDDQGHHQNLQGLFVVWERRSQWWTVCGRVDKGLHAKMGRWTRSAGSTLAKPRPPSPLALATTH